MIFKDEAFPSFPRLLVIGLSGGGADSLPAGLLGRIAAADLLVGGRRHLDYFPDFVGEKVIIAAEVEPVMARLQQARAAGQQAVILASGDPLCYGIAATLRRYFAAEVLEIVPAPTSFQLAFAALAEPWDEAVFLSAHTRSLPAVVAGVLAASKAAILTDNRHTPAVVAQALLDGGLSPDSPCAICENLGSPEQRVVRIPLGQVDRQSYAPLNVFVVWPDKIGLKAVPLENNSQSSVASSQKDVVIPCAHEGIGGGSKARDISSVFNLPIPPGLPDEVFSTTAGQITKREVRLLTLAELALEPGQVMWDIGAGSGSVSIEAGRAQPAARIYAVEKRTDRGQHLAENLRRFPTPNVFFFEGLAPEATRDWPNPHAVFVGGSGGQLPEIIDTARQRLLPGGRLVLNLAVLENLHTVCALLPEARLIQVQINRAVPIVDMLRLEAINPIFIVTWRKGYGEVI